MEWGLEKGSDSGGSSLSWVLAGCELVCPITFPPPFLCLCFCFSPDPSLFGVKSLIRLRSHFSQRMFALFLAFSFTIRSPPGFVQTWFTIPHGAHSLLLKERILKRRYSNETNSIQNMRAREKRKVERRSSPANPIQTHTLATDFANPRVPRITVPVLFPFFSTTT